MDDAHARGASGDRHAGDRRARAVCESGRQELAVCVAPLRHAIDALLVLDAPSRVTPHHAGSTAAPVGEIGDAG